MKDDIFQQALQKNSFELKYDLNVEGNIIPVKLKSMARRLIAKRQILNFEVELAKLPDILKKQGYDKDEWKRHLDQIKDEKIKEERKKNPPKSRAHQIAENYAISETVLDVIPEYLLDSEDNVLLKTDENKKAFRDYVDQNDVLFLQVMQMYLDIFEEYKKIQEKAKN